MAEPNPFNPGGYNRPPQTNMPPFQGNNIARPPHPGMNQPGMPSQMGNARPQYPGQNFPPNPGQSMNMMPGQPQNQQPPNFSGATRGPPPQGFGQMPPQHPRPPLQAQSNTGTLTPPPSMNRSSSAPSMPNQVPPGPRPPPMNGVGSHPHLGPPTRPPGPGAAPPPHMNGPPARPPMSGAPQPPHVNGPPARPPMSGAPQPPYVNGPPTRPPMPGAVPPHQVNGPPNHMPPRPQQPGPPMPGQMYNQGDVGQPPVSKPGFVGPPPRMIVPPQMDNQGRPMPPSSVPLQGSGGGLPVPFHGQGQYSHQVPGQPQGLTPTNSAPPSQKSSRSSSPVSANTMDALEGQFTGSPQGPPQPMGAVPPGAQQPMGGNYPPQNQPPGGITGRRQYPQMPSQVGYNQNTPPTSQPGYVNNTATAPQGQQMHPNNTPMHNNVGNLTDQYRDMKIQGDRVINLLQERNLIPSTGMEDAVPKLHPDYKKRNCSPEIFRCSLTTLPNSQSLLNKSRLPLGVLIHPFKDLSEVDCDPWNYDPGCNGHSQNQLPVIQSSVIVRCRSCRTYINPFVTFPDSRRWKCNLCFRVNELPDEFAYDPVSKTYGEPQRRPEIKSATIEFIAPSEYMLRPPQPAVYLYMLDVSFNAKETGYLEKFCETMLEELDRIPGDARTQIGFITYDRSLHFYNLNEDLSQPQMLVVSDVDDVFLPSHGGLLVNMHESKELVRTLLTNLPSMFANNMETGSALGAALQAAHKMMAPTGGRITIVQTQLPTVGPGALKNREDPNERAGKKIQHLNPAVDFYKKLALECSAQQIAVDLFLLNSQYADIATIAGISKFSGGAIHYFPGLHTVGNPAEAERFQGVLKRYVSRKIGFEAVMRIRCTRGLSIHTFHGNFFVRSTDLLSLPNINPDAGFGMQISIEDNIETNAACFQAALLYTSSKGERRIRVHTLCLPVTQHVNEVIAGADQLACVGLLAKMAVDRSLSVSISESRDAMINAAVDMLGSYGSTLTASQRLGQLPVGFSTRLMPVLVLALLKSTAFRVGSSTKLDDRVFAMEQMKTLPLCYMLQLVYPDLYAVHALSDQNAITKGDNIIPQPGVLQLTTANIDRHGVYLMDCGNHVMLWVGAAVSDQYCQEVFDVQNFAAIQDGMHKLPELDNPVSDRLRSFLDWLFDQKPSPPSFIVLREDSRARMQFLQYMIEDRTESSMSYYEFLQSLQKEIKS